MDDKDKQEPQKPLVRSEDEFAVHRQMVVWLFIATATLSLTLGITLGMRLYLQKGASLLITVLAAGALGGFVSSLRRLYLFGSIFPSPDFSRWLKKANLYVAIYSSIPPLIGAIAAVVLYLMFASTMLSGPLFPDFACRESADGACDSFQEFIRDWRPKTATDQAKSIVWGFVAGFSERFVPNIIHRAATENAREGA